MEELKRNYAMKLWSVREVAEKLSISEYTVIEFLKKGSMQGHKVGRQWRITEQQLNEYLESVKNTGGE